MCHGLCSGWFSEDKALFLARANLTKPDILAAISGRSAMEIFPGISMNPNIRFGKPCLTGTRLDVATVVGALAAGESFEAVQEAYAITREQILAALRYAAHVAEHVPPLVENTC